jgi:hypothetical protein
MDSMMRAAVGVAFIVSAAGLALASDEADELMPGSVAIVKPANLAKFVAKGTFDLPDAANDPTTEGGSLRIFDTTAPGAGDDTYGLPASGWTGLGSPAGAGGYKYRGTGSGLDPCRLVIVKAAVVKAVCRGTGVTLTPPFAGDAGVVLSIGTGTKRYCATFGGTTVKNQAGLFKRKAAAAPGACPSVPGTTTTTTIAGTTTTSSTSDSTTTSTSTSTTTTTLTPPCAATAPPPCDGDCGGPGAMCMDGGGFCMCAPSGGMPCGAGAPPPVCWGECPVPGQACVDTGGAAGCVCAEASGAPTCTPGLLSPLCDGGCGPGSMCTDPGGGCMCVPTAGPCGVVAPAPVCLGDCPPGLACRSTGPILGCTCF